MRDVRIVPNFGINVLGESIFLDKGAAIIKEPDPITKRIYTRIIHPDGDVLLRCERHKSGLFLLYPADSCSYAFDACGASAAACSFHSNCTFAASDNSQLDALMHWQ